MKWMLHPLSFSFLGEDRRYFGPMRLIFRVVLAASILLFALNAWGGSIVGTRHNLSVTGLFEIKSDTEGEICIFCHAPHRARPGTTLWNREDSTAEYQTYDSTTMRATVGQPTGASALCLSCHDGTIALGAVVSRREEISFPVGLRFLTDDRPSYIGTDLRGDHPVSFLYQEALDEGHAELVLPASLPPEVRLDRAGMLQCTSCHDPHNDQYKKFLVMENIHAALCTSCHAPTGWGESSHATSEAVWLPPQEGDDPWPHTDYETVDDNACASCHRPHKAGSARRLLSYEVEASVCLVCHNGNVATKDILYELGKEVGGGTGHFVQNYNLGLDDSHDPTEGYISEMDYSGEMDRHVQCVDCHNPHRAKADAVPATAPNVPGTMLGVAGINRQGGWKPEADFMYEICLRCHSGLNQFVPDVYTYIERQFPQTDKRIVFDSSVSRHPVMDLQQFTWADLPSLKDSPYQNGGKSLYCTDYHGNDDSGGPKGPHGSSHRYLLVENYTTGDNTVESNLEYALCYACHDRTSILNTGNPSGFPHKTHIGDYQAPCSACHDPHGSTVNTHLINFDLGIVGPYDPLGVNLLAFVDNGSNAGSCTLVCHGSSHDGTALYSYP